MKSVYPVLSRSLFAFFFLFTSLYCLLAYVPFTYQQVIKGGLIPQLLVFARIEHWIYWLFLVIIFFALGWDGTRSLRWFWYFHLAGGAALLIHPVLGHLENNLTSLLWSIAHMVPVFWLAQITWSRHYPRVNWCSKITFEDRRVFGAAWQAAVFLAVSYAFVGWLHRLAPFGKVAWNLNAEIFGFGVSLLSHVLVFLFFFTLLNLIGVIAGWCPRPVLVQFVLCHFLGAGAMWLVFRSIVFSAMSFEGTAAQVFSVSYSAAVTVFLSGICIVRASSAQTPVENGLSLAFWIVDSRTRSLPRNLVAVLAVAITAWALLTNAAKMDWNYLVQKLTVVLIWVTAFRLFYRTQMAMLGTPRQTGRFLMCAIVIVPTYRMYEAMRPIAWSQIDRKLTVAQFLDRWTGYDVSLKIIHDALAPEVADQGFYRFLVQNTNIARSTQVNPIPIDFVNDLKVTAAKKPNIFMITVDSMRRDYLSPYNSDVDFTPEIAKFAKESIVMEHAFTHYGGTGLSEPSIWVGGMLLHKQYVTPFAPMNTLEKLLQAEQYHAYISRDTILETVVTPWDNMTPMDEGRGTMDYDLCTTLDELTGKIAADTSGAPLFSYTQPQNLHISVITRQGGKPISNENFRSFYAPYASRLKRIDACFGKFIDSLKSRGIYDNSIVVLAADHGDSLGEQGRWGHAYTIYPEIVRIPLIMHVPTALRENLKIDTKALAFSTDITPTLYYLLGHRPTVHQEFLGKPLFVENEDERKTSKADSYLIASSYAAVYGILSSDGMTLTVSDAVGYKDYGFNLSSFLSDDLSLSGSAKTANEELIRKKILALDKYYGFKPSEAAH